MKIALVGAGSSVGRHLLSLNDSRFTGIYRSPKALSQLCDLGLNDKLVRVTSQKEMVAAFRGFDTVVTLINDENPQNALNSLKDVVAAAKTAAVPQLIHMSSAAIYGQRPDLAVKSDSRGLSITWNSYAAGKQWQEDFLRSSRNLPPSTVILRPGLIWGAGMAWLHAPAGEVLRGSAWVPETDSPCNLVHIDLLTHSILEMAASKPKGLVFTNIRDKQVLTWAEYYEQIATYFNVKDFHLVRVSASGGLPWKSYPGVARATFPLGIGWSVAPRPVKNFVKSVAKSLPKRADSGQVAIESSSPSLYMNREVWELKTAKGLPASSPVLEELQRSFGKSAQDNWSSLSSLKPWMIV